MQVNIRKDLPHFLTSTLCPYGANAKPQLNLRIDGVEQKSNDSLKDLKIAIGEIEKSSGSHVSQSEKWRSYWWIKFRVGEQKEILKEYKFKVTTQGQRTKAKIIEAWTPHWFSEVSISVTLKKHGQIQIWPNQKKSC